MKKYKFQIFIFWLIFSIGILSMFGVFYLASIGKFGEMPDFRQLENPKTNFASEIVSSDNQILGKYYFNDNRTPVEYDEINPETVNALIATEDERFYSHPGIDLKATIRAIVFLNTRGGASTISQQLARQLFVGVRSRNIFQAIGQKIKEWVIAVELEKQYTKEEIITMYLNIYDFGYYGDGIKSASNIYFSKEPIDLKVEESAMLIGMLQNSSLYDPIRRPEITKKRRDLVLMQMEKNGFLTSKQKDSIQNIPLELNYTPQSHRQGLATYFRSYLRGFMKDWINNNLKNDGTKYNLYIDGLKIYTTINAKMQKYAEEAVVEHMKNLQKEFFIQNDTVSSAPFTDLEEDEEDLIMKRAMRRSERWRKAKLSGKTNDEIEELFFEPKNMTVFSWDGDIDTLMTPIDSIRYYKHFLRAGMMSMNPKNGHVKAWVGGINYRNFQYDHVMLSKRQIGSTFKPFLYATAIDQLKLSPCDVLPDLIHCIEPYKYGNPEPWCPTNSSDKYGGVRTLSNALANSKNTISAQLIDKVGPRPVADLARNLGVSSNIPNVPAIALGTPDLSVYEMVGAYGAFANKGIYVKPIMVTKIEDKNGTIIYQSKPETRDVLSEESSYVTLKLLEGVTKFGSGARLRHNIPEDERNYVYNNVVTGYPYKFQNAIAGKTGTTQNQSDGWFIGMVPNLVTGVWVGGEDRSVHFKDIAFGQGATMSLPIWGLFMNKCYEDEELSISKEDFDEPESLSIELDCSKILPDESESDESDINDLLGIGS
ncbi:MAG: transglycosylase domain-containing protein [Flavobacteriaceae bacterium]|nr:transglycosylase domain-containing protein [Flavobacteriaceae bacterium]MBL6685025.1 transglycosylase domain-containing protein [Flavobacteriaceae bacterium]